MPVSWFAETLTVDQTHCFTPEEMASELREIQAEHGVDYGYALWLQEYFCSFDAAIPGSIWGDCVKAAEDSGRVLDFEIDRKILVNTAWDLGRTDDTSIWWDQLTPVWIDIFDHHSSSMKDIPFYMHLLEEKRVQYGLTYGTHYLPHDARPRTLAAGGKSIWQQCQDAARVNPKLGRFVIGKRLDKQEHIQAARKTFPSCRFHRRCEKGLNSLRQYHREWDAEAKVFKDSPEHDWSSHDADSFMELSMSWKRTDAAKPESPLVDKLLAMNPNQMAFKALRERHFARKRAAREAVA